MKKAITVILVFFACITGSNCKAQAFMGLYGSGTNSLDFFSPDRGAGISISIFGEGDTLSAKKKVKPLVAQFGVSGFYTGMGNRMFYRVPLLSPSVGYGEVKLSNNMYGGSFVARFYYGSKKTCIPYIDLSAGGFAVKSRLTITPNYDISYVDHTKTRQDISSATGFDYGIGGGLLFTLNKKTKLDMGVSYTGYLSGGAIADIHSAYADAGGINLNLKGVPQSMFALHVGFVFYIEKSKFSVRPNYINTYDVPDPNVTYPIVHYPSYPGGGIHYPSYPSGRTGGGGSINGGMRGGSWGGGGGGHVGVHVGGGGHGSMGHGR
jgi:hypothetical protein